MNIINTNGIKPQHIRLELTESAIFDDFNMVINNMEKFNKSGIKFYLDDFGTGYSNLDYSINKGFDYIQGYKYAKPQPVIKLREYFNKATA